MTKTKKDMTNKGKSARNSNFKIWHHNW